ncbi:unnamed protein product [Miscanthus lutarioriparius]|uniref:Uncharacterized protein n=1 Tax=Miscanthus lutarioriparius TaxID=422564 RepID=A0A811PPR2_9POAL|nr:unnamed protein product [Miscanthus lutarioriparius]
MAFESQADKKAQVDLGWLDVGVGEAAVGGHVDKRHVNLDEAIVGRGGPGSQERGPVATKVERGGLAPRGGARNAQPRALVVEEADHRRTGAVAPLRSWVAIPPGVDGNDAGHRGGAVREEVQAEIAETAMVGGDNKVGDILVTRSRPEDTRGDLGNGEVGGGAENAKFNALVTMERETSRPWSLQETQKIAASSDSKERAAVESRWRAERTRSRKRAPGVVRVVQPPAGRRCESGGSRSRGATLCRPTLVGWSGPGVVVISQPVPSRHVFHQPTAAAASASLPARSLALMHASGRKTDD